MIRLAATVLLWAVLSAPVWGAGPLPALAVRSDALTVSGVSSGGYMAVQFHIAHSRQVVGVGVFAGGPYRCAESGHWPSYRPCLTPDTDHPLPTTDTSIDRVERDARAGLIDNPAALNGDRVWLLSGGRDDRVDEAVVDALEQFYRHWIDPADLDRIRLTDAGHAMITGESGAGVGACGDTGSPYINYCPGVDPPGLLLSHLLGPLAPKTGTQRGELLAFDQTDFRGGTGAMGLGETGFVYIPSSCRGGGCRLHIVFHGCRQSVDQIDTLFVERAGYNRWAESNRIVVLYPQVQPRYGWTWTGNPWRWFEWVFNPYGCWDWWGYDNDLYATREGDQIGAVSQMVARLAEPGSRR